MNHAGSSTLGRSSATAPCNYPAAQSRSVAIVDLEPPMKGRPLDEAYRRRHTAMWAPVGDY
jgi:hypothetical protein